MARPRNKDRDEVVLRMWADGAEAADIGKVIGLAVPGVNSIVRRLRILGGPDAPGPRRRGGEGRFRSNNNALGRNGRPPALGAPRPFTPRHIEGQPTEGTKPFLDYRYRADCAFPMWADGARFTPDAMVCGRPSDGHQYCPVHTRLTYEPRRSA